MVNTDYLRDRLTSSLQKIDLLNQDINHSIIDTLIYYTYLVYKYNDRFSLTGVELKEFPRLITESLLPIKEFSSGSLLDIGSGGGIPAIPLKVVKDDISFTLLEPSRGKWFALKEIVYKLGLHNMTILQTQLENYAKAGVKFNYITVRGISPKYDFFKKIDELAQKNTRIIYYREDFPDNLINFLENRFYEIYNINAIDEIRGVTIFSRQE